MPPDKVVANELRSAEDAGARAAIAHREYLAALGKFDWPGAEVSRVMTIANLEAQLDAFGRAYHSLELIRGQR